MQFCQLAKHAPDEKDLKLMSWMPAVGVFLVLAGEILSLQTPRSSSPKS
jgi:hypothetical protein